MEEKETFTEISEKYLGVKVNQNGLLMDVVSRIKDMEQVDSSYMFVAGDTLTIRFNNSDKKLVVRDYSKKKGHLDLMVEPGYELGNGATWSAGWFEINSIENLIIFIRFLNFSNKCKKKIVWKNIIPVTLRKVKTLLKGSKK